jgi:pyruvate kinase
MDATDQRPEYEASARNLAHYLAPSDGLRIADTAHALGPFIDRRCSPTLLRQSTTSSQRFAPMQSGATGSRVRRHSTRGTTVLRRKQRASGRAPEKRRERIMVTFPEAASDFGLVRDLVANGMNIARVNCAHDSQAE